LLTLKRETATLEDIFLELTEAQPEEEEEAENESDL
jgi:hypothetical protein